jgi:hypothetical protein
MNFLPRRHRDTEKKIQCGVYFTHGNTVGGINATLLEERQREGGEVRVVYTPPLSL